MTKESGDYAAFHLRNTLQIPVFMGRECGLRRLQTDFEGAKLHRKVTNLYSPPCICVFAPLRMSCEFFGHTLRVCYRLFYHAKSYYVR